jgi:hypothetical protein
VNRLRIVVVAFLCVAALVGCKKAKNERRGYRDDREIGTGTDIVDGTIAAPLRVARQAQIDTMLYSINQLIQTEMLVEGSYPKDLEEVKALWTRETRRPWPEPVFRYKYLYDPQTGKVSQVHKTPEEYTQEEREGTGRGPH